MDVGLLLVVLGFALLCLALVVGLTVFLVRSFSNEAKLWREANAETLAHHVSTTDKTLKELSGLCALPIAVQQQQLAFAEKKLALEEKRDEANRELKDAQRKHMQHINNLRMNRDPEQS